MRQISPLRLDSFVGRLAASLLAAASVASLGACTLESEAGGAPIAKLDEVALTSPAPAAHDVSVASYLLKVGGQSAGPLRSGIGGSLRGVVRKDGNKKSISSISYEPIVLEAPGNLNPKLFDWINSSWSSLTTEQTGSISSLDSTYEVQGVLEMFNARITEVKFPLMSTSATPTNGTLSVKLAPESTHHLSGSGHMTPGPARPNWTTNSFELDIDDVDMNVERIEPFTVKDAVTPPPANTPIIDYGNLTVTVRRDQAGAFIQWANTFLADVPTSGQGDAGERNGQLKLLDASGQNTLMAVRLEHVGIVRVSDSTTDPDRVIVELYAESMVLTR
jgi:hypothetical protein